MIIRVRSNGGTWRVDNLNDSSNSTDILNQIALTRPNVEYEKPLSFDAACNSPLDTNASLSSQNLAHGSLIYCCVDASTCATSVSENELSSSAASLSASSTTNSKHTKRVIAADGSIRLEHDSIKSSLKDGFRQGMLPLRDMKRSWTLQEFVDMDNQFVFKIQRQEERWVGEGGVSLDQESANGFQSYLRTFAFQRQRFGLLYGRFVEEEEEDGKKPSAEKPSTGTTLSGVVVVDDDDMHDSSSKKGTVKQKNQKVLVEAIYEPPQEADPSTPEGFVVLDDPMEDKVEDLAKMLGLQKVGWIFGHPPREKGFQMSAAEIIMAAEFQLEAADGVNETPFVTVKVTMGDDGNVSFEAFQVSSQCMAMVADGALEVATNPKFCQINETFTAIQEGKESKTVENNFFLTVVPIVQHASEVFVSEFPRCNRDHDSRTQSNDEMKKQLSKSGKAGWTFIDLLADFNLLIYLCKFLDMKTDIDKICRSIVNRDLPLDEGYKLIIASMAGLDNAY